MKRTATVILLTMLLTVIAITAHRKQAKSVSTTTIEGVVRTIETETFTEKEPETTETTTEYINTTAETETSKMSTFSQVYDISPAQFRRAGVIYWGNYRWTWYSERVLAGGGLNIPNRHSDGDFVRDGDENICLASSDLAKGTVIDTPFGKGKVYDTGCASGTVDIYVSW